VPGPASLGIAVSGALLDASVLAVVAQADTYGYVLTQQIRERLAVADSTIYPVLRRLQRDGCLWCYDVPTDGRNRRYYACTDLGRQRLAALTTEWLAFRTTIDELLTRETT